MISGATSIGTLYAWIDTAWGATHDNPILAPVTHAAQAVLPYVSVGWGLGIWVALSLLALGASGYVVIITRRSPSRDPYLGSPGDQVAREDDPSAPMLRVEQDDIRLEADPNKSDGYGWGIYVWNDGTIDAQRVRAQLALVVPMYRDERIGLLPRRPLHWPQTGDYGLVPRGHSARFDLIRYAPGIVSNGGHVETIAEWAFASMEPTARESAANLSSTTTLLARIALSYADRRPYFLAVSIDPTWLTMEAIDAIHGVEASDDSQPSIRLLYAGEDDPDLQEWRRPTSRVVAQSTASDVTDDPSPDCLVSEAAITEFNKQLVGKITAVWDSITYVPKPQPGVAVTAGGAFRGQLPPRDVQYRLAQDFDRLALVVEADLPEISALVEGRRRTLLAETDDFVTQHYHDLAALEARLKETEQSRNQAKAMYQRTLIYQEALSQSVNPRLQQRLQTASRRIVAALDRIVEQYQLLAESHLEAAGRIERRAEAL